MTSGLQLTDVTYRYFITDLVSNQVIAELPFTGVSYARELRRAGSFSGTIPVIEETKKYDLYETTMPGRTGLYVMRNDSCVWGGIIWAREYNESSKELTIDASEFSSYFYHRHVWQTLIYGSEFIGIKSFSIEDGIATITTEVPHGLDIFDKVKITFTNPLVDGTHEVYDAFSDEFQIRVSAGNVDTTSITSGAVRKLIDTYDFVRDLVFQVSSDISLQYGDFSYGTFANEVIGPSQALESSLIQYQIDSYTVTFRTRDDHQIIPGQEVEIANMPEEILNGYFTVVDVPDWKSFTVESFYIESEPPVALPGIRSFYVTQAEITNNEATLTTHLNHGIEEGQFIFVSGVDSFFAERLDINYDGKYVVTSVTNNTVSYEKIVPADVPSQVISGGRLTVGTKVMYGTYGPYTANSDLAIEVLTEEEQSRDSFFGIQTSNKFQDTQYLRGFELKSFGEILEDYSNNLDGFEYRIDCDFNTSTNSFTRTLVLMDPENPKGYLISDVADSSTLTDQERLGYNNIVFEYPGSISTFTVSESAEDAATRFFVQGKLDGFSDAASQPYAVASDIYMLNNKNGRSWPLLDQVEMLDNTFDENILYSYAKEYLYEAKPPIGDIDITVNGSLTPVIGSYNPGDWCTLIIDDPFVLARLANDQEPRDDILVRKIMGYKVTVPDNPSFPETVDVDLATDWKVDKSGEESGLTEAADTERNN